MDVISISFSLEDRSNSVRSEMSRMLIDEFSFAGAGFGNGLDSQYIRDINGYSFELSYHSLIFKLGLFSFPLIAVYIFLLSKSCFLVLASEKIDYRSSAALGCSLCLVPAYGNPVLFSPTFVLLQVIGIVFLMEYRTSVRR